MFKFPYTNLHELNLDWILEKVKTFSELIPPMETAVEDVQGLQTDVEQAVEDASQAVQDAQSAIQTAEEAKEIAEQASQGTIADGSVTTAKLADGAVTSAKIADGSISGNDIAPGTIQTGNLSQGCVTTVQILDGTITSTDLGTESVTTDKLGTSAVTTGKINDGAVTTAKIADGAVTPVKVPNGDGTFSRYDPDGVISTWWASTIKYWGAIGSLTLAMQITLPSDSTYHTIGTIDSTLAPTSAVEQTEAVGADTHSFTLRVDSDGSVAIRNTSGSNITSKAVAIQILYLMNIT